MLLKRLLLLCTLVMLMLAALSTSAQTRTPTPTLTPSPTPRTRTVNTSRLRNATRGLQLNAAADEFPPACWQPSSDVAGWNVANPVASGQLTEQSALNRNDGALMRITEAYFPAICSTQPLSGAAAVSPGGRTVTPLTWTYDGTPLHYEGFFDPYNVVQLPLSAYREPGIWRLSVTGPQPYEIQIRVPPANGPFGLLDPFNGGYLVGGFTPGERVLGILYGSTNDELIDAFEITIDGSGYGAIDGFRFQPPAALYLVGNQGHGLYYPAGTVLFGGERTDIPGIEDGLQPDDVYAYLRANYFEGGDVSASSVTGTCGPFSLRLFVGGQAQRAGNTNVRIRNNPSRSAQQIGLINNNTPAAVLDGPQCVDNVPWWQINYNGVIGWAAEAADGLILLAPAGGSAPPANNNPPPANNVPSATPFVPTLIPTEVPVVSTSGLEHWQTPTYGTYDLVSGFTPDPYPVGVTSGGSVNVSYLGGSCVGYATGAPDVSLNYTSGSFPFLRIYFIGDGDATLIVNDASGGWHCNDDSYGSRNPSLDFGSPASGQYDIWLGSYSAGTFVGGTLYFTELENNHP